MTPALTMGWTDTHCHTQEQMVETGSDELLQRARLAGVERFVVIGTDAVTSAQAIEIAGKHADVWATSWTALDVDPAQRARARVALREAFIAFAILVAFMLLGRQFLERQASVAVDDLHARVRLDPHIIHGRLRDCGVQLGHDDGGAGIARARRRRG